MLSVMLVEVKVLRLDIFACVRETTIPVHSMEAIVTLLHAFYYLKKDEGNKQ